MALSARRTLSRQCDLSRRPGAKGRIPRPTLFRHPGWCIGRPQGWASYLRIEPAQRCIEVGWILYTPALQRTVGATEAMYLMARHAFEDLGYRRYEWRCNALNAPSRRAALRLGFTFEGIFRQHMIVKGRNRDSAWFSMLDTEWPVRKTAFERWLDPTNFDAEDGSASRSLHSTRCQATTERRMRPSVESTHGDTVAIFVLGDG